MTANPKASTTVLWLKQLTTHTFFSINRRLQKVAFLQRNSKMLALVLLGWGLTVAAVFFLFGALSERNLTELLKGHAAATLALANTSAPLLMEDDVLHLNREINEFARTRNLIFAAVINHQNKIVAHTNADQFNQTYQAPAKQKKIAAVGEVDVEMVRNGGGAPILTFTKPITFSGVKIGAVVYALPENLVSATQVQFRWYTAIVVFALTAAAALLLLFNDRGKRKLSPKGMKVPSDGTRIGPYMLKEKIAQGGMAELWIADYRREDGFKRQVAIKKVLPHLSENLDFIKMFIREARLAALLQHPNIVQIFDFGKIQDTYVIAMEYIQGMNLGQVMARLKGPLPLEPAIFIITKISLGLDYSHKRKDDESGKILGIVHRDVSPQNILLSYQGEVKISDFGISKATTEPSLTQAGIIKGKLSYLAPEQALGQAVDHRADIYALGLVFYEILSGQRLCQFDSDIEAIRKIPEMDFPPLRTARPNVPAGLEEIVMKCLSKDPEKRYGDAMALHDDLVRLKNQLQMIYDASEFSKFMQTISNHA